MRTLKFRDRDREANEYFMYSDDVERIVRVAAMRGYILSQSDARAAWEAYSADFAAGWMALPEDDDDLWLNVEYYLA